ncbi:MAG: hypothetical protein EOM34_09650 [Clostridia bacterium]|nr:hypothetical protein [Clostridia bacterium]NCD02412.1 hypothetical protein [Clostridia bacterium]
MNIILSEMRMILLTLNDAFEAFIYSRILADLSPKTIRCYRDFVSPFVIYTGSSLEIENLNKDMINNYIMTLYARPLSKTSKATYIRHLKTCLRWLENTYKLDIDVSSIRIPRTFKKMIHVYSNDEILYIFQSIRTSSSWMTARNKAIIALMLDSGLRQGEVCSLLHKDIHYKDSIIKICGKGNKERVVPLGTITAIYLKEYFKLCPFDSIYAFVGKKGLPLTCDAIKHLVHKLAEQLPFEFSSHKLRHNFATNYCLDQYNKYGHMDVYRLMVLMGHEDIETTRRYLHMANRIIATQTNISHIDSILTKNF